MPDPGDLMKGFRVGHWTVLPERGLLREETAEEHLEPKVMEVLVRLAAANGEVVSKQRLMDEVWGDSPSGEEVITRCIAVLRAAFHDDARRPRIIETLSRRGYRLMLPIASVIETPVERSAVASRKNRLVVIAGVAILLMALFGYWRAVQVSPDAEGIKSIAVFSFECEGSIADDQQYLCSGISDLLISSLVEAGSLRVVKMRGALPDQLPQDIAANLGVDGLITGTLQHHGGQYRIAAELLSGVDGAILWTYSAIAAVDRLFDSQEALSTDLQRELMRAATPLQPTSRSSSPEAFDHFLRGQYQLERRSRGSVEQAIDLFEKSISLDPQFSPAYLRQAYAYLILPDLALELSPDAMFRLAAATIAAGIEIDPGLRTQGRTIDAYLHQKKRQWQLADEAFSEATASAATDPLAHSWHSRLLANTGRLDESLAAAQRSMQLDPNSPAIISRVAIASFWVGNTDAAELYFGMVDQMVFAAPIHDLAYSLFLIEQSRVDEARDRAKAGLGKRGLETAWVGPVFDGIVHADRKADALALIDRLANDGQLPLSVQMTLWMVFGETDRALQAAIELAESSEIFELELVFSDSFGAMRGHADFQDLLQRAGLVAYWQSIGCEWLARRLQCP